MLETYVKTAAKLARLRSGPTGPFIDSFADSLRESGYAHSTVRGQLRIVAHFGAWMDLEGLAFGALEEQAVTAFAEHLPACTCSWRTRCDQSYLVAGARLLLTHLRDQGVVPRAPATEADRLPEIIERFEHWMNRHRGVVASTLTAYQPIVTELVQKVGTPEDFTAAALRGFVSERAARHGRSRAKTVVSAVRMFLRYVVSQGLCESELVAAIPTIANWRLSSLPAYLPPEQVERIVGAAEPTTPMGRRDRAILLLLARLGLRAGDVVGLRLADIDWQAGTLLVGGKGRRACRLPLPQEAGDAILAYLADGRPDVADDHIFLRLLAPIGKLESSAAVSFVVRRAAGRAGVKMPGGRAHVLRHSLATALVRKGMPLPTIRVLLRHRSEETTAHYAKVDVPALRKVAQPWPLEASSC